MMIPSTYTAALLLTFFTMLCWGSWANTLKFSGKWRFELFCFDYAFGVLVCAIFVSFTFGTYGSEITFLDNLTIVRYRQIGFGVLGGTVFNLANMLLVGAISIAGMAVAFPIGIGLALIIGVVWNYLLKPAGNPILLFSGAAVIAGAVFLTALAYRLLQKAKPAPKPVHGDRRPARRPVSMKGVIVSLVSGMLMGSFYPLVEMGKQGDIEMGPYPIGLVFAVGVFCSTFLYNIYFVNLPLQGGAISMLDYFRGNFRQHALGWIGGMIWYAGTIANFAASSAPASVQVGPAISYAIGQGATLISTLWGLMYWKEFAGASLRAKYLIGVVLVLYVTGLGMISVAPLFAG